MPTYTAKALEYKTTQGEIWDIVGLRVYGDEHTMHFVQDANFEHRFVDAFPGGVILSIPRQVTVAVNLKSRRPTPNLKELLPWLST